MKRIKYKAKKIYRIIVNKMEMVIPFRKWLERNKVLFEIIHSVGLAFMSIIIAIAGINIDKKNKEISEKQLEIMNNDREPYFTIKSEIYEDIYEGSDYNYTKKIYTIKNEGGLITGACVPKIYSYIFIKVLNNETGEEYTYVLYFDDIFEKEKEIYSFYDSDKKEFKLYKHESEKLNKLVPELKEEFAKTFLTSGRFHEYTIDAYLKNCIEIEYANFQNEEFKQRYQLIDEEQVFLIRFDDNIDEAFLIGTTVLEENLDGFGKAICVLLKNTIKFGSDEEALEMAKKYLSTFTYSREGLIEQLNIRDIFSYDNAVYAADNCGADWNYQAKRRIEGYIHTNKACSYNELIKLLEDEGYTYEQAVYGVEQNGYTK